MREVVPPNKAARLTCAGGSVYFGSASPGKRIGDRQWICGSMPPGMTILPVASTVRAAAASEPGAPIMAILPPATPISATIAPFGNTQVPPDMTRSSITVPRCYVGCFHDRVSGDKPVQQHVGGNVADNEHQAATVIGIGPRVEPPRRIERMLHGVNLRRSLRVIGEGHQSLHAQQVFAVLTREASQRHGEIKP